MCALFVCLCLCLCPCLRLCLCLCLCLSAVLLHVPKANFWVRWDSVVPRDIYFQVTLTHCLCSFLSFISSPLAFNPPNCTPHNSHIIKTSPQNNINYAHTQNKNPPHFNSTFHTFSLHQWTTTPRTCPSCVLTTAVSTGKNQAHQLLLPLLHLHHA